MGDSRISRSTSSNSSRARLGAHFPSIGAKGALMPNNSMEPTRPAGGYEVRDTSLGWPGGSSRGR